MSRARLTNANSSLTLGAVTILSANDLSKSYGNRTILAGVNLSIAAGERLGLVGSNGSGKSTLARILAGLDEPDSGQIARGRTIRLGYLEQVPDLPAGASAIDAVLAGLDEWARAVSRHQELSAAIAAGSGNPDVLLGQLAEVAADVDRLGGWDLRHQASAVLGHLGIADPGLKVDTMSGGERRRVALARLLIAQPEIAILDEPTNHLDIDTIEWLERYLSERWSGALLLITHDRYLLDRVVTRTLELDAGSLYSYDGGWEEYLAAKAERQAHAERVEANRKNFLSRELEWLRRQPKARTGKQKARISRAEAVLSEERTGPARTAKLAVTGVRSGHSVLDIENLDIALGGRTLVKDLRLSLGKGERVGVVGPNGSGKTSLVRVLLGELAPAAGTVRVGQNARIAYLDQSRSGLDDSQTVYDSVADNRPNIRVADGEITVHAYLERFLFSVPAQSQKIGTLSGGERARVALARILRDQVNLVILDEPTNDLDVTTLAALEESLLDFAGTLLVVTHDRWFLDRVATSILAFEGTAGSPAGSAPRVVHVHGNYQSYLEYRQSEERRREQMAAQQQAARPAPVAQTAQATQAASKKRRGLTYGERIELEGLMERIAEAETTVAELEAELATPSFYDRTHTEQAMFLERLAQAKAAAEALVERWADLEARKDE